MYVPVTLWSTSLWSWDIWVSSSIAFKTWLGLLTTVLYRLVLRFWETLFHHLIVLQPLTPNLVVRVILLLAWSFMVRDGNLWGSSQKNVNLQGTRTVTYLLDIATWTVGFTVVASGLFLEVLNVKLEYLDITTALKGVLYLSVRTNRYLVTVIIFVTESHRTRYLYPLQPLFCEKMCSYVSCDAKKWALITAFSNRKHNELCISPASNTMFSFWKDQKFSYDVTKLKKGIEIVEWI